MSEGNGSKGCIVAIVWLVLLAILGGAVTKVGSTVYDGSLKTHLDRLRRKMTQE